MDIAYSNNRTGSDIGIPVFQVDKIILDIIEEYKNSSKSLWKCAEKTYGLFEQYGLYERNFTETLVHELGVQRDTIYHWRKAWSLRLAILETDPDFSFENLSISHFYQSADYIEKLGLPAVHDFLELASEEAMSSRSLNTEMQIASNDSGTYPWLIKRLQKIVNSLDTIYESSEFSGLSGDKRQKLIAALKNLKEIMS
jgi:hypothetical protein